MVVNTKGFSAADCDIAKLEYREFCKTQDSLQVFAQDWYLDAVCDSQDDWQVILVKKRNKIIAAFPFLYHRSKHNLYTISNPPLTPRLGIWMDYEDKKTQYFRENFENMVVNEIISKLPEYDCFKIAFDNRFTNWQAFYRAGFSQTTYYSYVIYKDRCLDEVFQSISSKRRRKIRKAQNLLDIYYGMSGDEYFDFMEKSYVKRNRVISYERRLFLRLYKAIKEHDAGQIRAAIDKNGEVCAVSLVFEDNLRSYEMFGTFDPDKEPGGRSLLTLDEISAALSRGKTFDFEGSMLPEVANYNMEFNAVKEPYYVISNYSKRMRFIQNCRENFRIIYNKLKKKEPG